MKRFLLFVSLFGLALALPLEEDDLINDDDIRSILDTISPEARVAFGNKTCSCGKRNAATRIVGGTVALKNEFPWRTTMYTTTSRHFCAGTIISRNWVLTAAHCTAAVRGQTLYANVGDHDTSTREETKSQLIRCSQVIQHERYNPRTYDNDIALCKLATRLTYSRSVSSKLNLNANIFVGSRMVCSNFILCRFSLHVSRGQWHRGHLKIVMLWLQDGQVDTIIWFCPSRIRYLQRQFFNLKIDLKTLGNHFVRR